MSQRLVWKLYLHFHTYFLLRLSGAVMRQEGYDGNCGGAKSFLNHFLSLALPVRWEIFFLPIVKVTLRVKKHFIDLPKVTE